ncbi:Jag family protein [Halodesulfovibrio marinisediminis]|uniref:RNA-binding protein KhpB n=1 Tax=Halodesulfovibrio marinisediminis DSM 17456 TaxID=1121457 RepID=A0A1N6IEF5_9BACT|nr:protein jag [Halodesulfovibrio marinisediminis]SIO30424.1 spoIIIJ-associated protein [Halodesulfovibrio marinisediminis DSM 17456]
MDGYKEFKGKTLDNAIEEACRYFNSPREKLEIDLINDAKTGIFGLVGAKKAKIKARRMQVQFDTQTLSAPLETSRRPKKSAASVTAEPETERKTEKPKQQERPKRRPEKTQSVKQQKTKEKPEASPEEAQAAKPKQERGRSQRSKQEGSRGQKKQTQKPSEKPQGAKPARKKHEVSEEKLEGQKRSRNGQRRRPQKQQAPKSETAPAPKKQRPAPKPEPVIEPVKAEPIPEANLDELDQAELLKVVTEVVNRLITPVIGETPVEARIEDGRVKASISSGDNSGLLIGREGQTLASFQYLANRIVAKIFGVAVRVQLDTGDYRERQDEKLRDIALHLAEKAKNMGKPQSTRPLSSYHRRVVHLALQEDDEIQTRSKGDGPLKRVIISRKRK